MKSQDDRLRAMRFAQTLARRRQELGLNQAELTRRVRAMLTNDVKLDRASMSRYESGQNLPRPEVVQALAAVLEIPPQELIPAKVEASQSGPNLVAQPDGSYRLTMDLVLPYDVALDILKLVGAAKPVEKKES
ncbi:helix-turn-helix domain-containing protein [Bosea sp. TND4EK4]|uniref:helix-turn-helix domain-containing protein n=1 Tax=Bosea sp. TND4EK4 TaxID=1907408 RepID=UPI00095689F4|nr:helix-turn-helix domain-containing protein [Bosea sp. TND4EK4]SIQ75923.1 Helix-turn-helix domain-containing protein [Bosea sp. TND4EK4]